MLRILNELISHIFFAQVRPILQLAKTKILQVEDFLPLPAELKVSNAYQNTQQRLMPSKQKPLRLLMALVWRHRRWMLPAYGFYFIFVLAGLISPNLLNLFLKNLEAASEGASTWYIGTALALNGILAGVILQHYFFRALKTWQLITNELNSLLFEKSLRISLHAKTQGQVGDVVNLMSSDTDAVADFPMMLGDLMWMLSMIVGVSAMLFYYIGVSAILPLLLLAGLAPLTSLIARKFIHYDEKMMEFRDRRVTLMGQILAAIRLVKYFAWEKAVIAEVSAVRKQELAARKKLAWAEVFSGFCYVLTGSLVLFIALYVHSSRGYELSASLIFTCLALFMALEDPFGHMSKVFSRFAQGIVSMGRIQKFLALDEKQETAEWLSKNEIAFQFAHANVRYHQHGPQILKNLCLTVQRGQSIALVGPVGAGKSTLLHSLMQECSIDGALRFGPAMQKIAYVPQEAHIINGSLLENIVFGQGSFSRELLRKSLHLVSFDRDVRQIKGGLRAEIGERGINLSGGQKQRVALARAVLAQPEVVLLDDPLSAVDVQTESELCAKLLFQHWSQITRIVATHRLDHLQKFDQVIFLLHGEVQAMGKLPELLLSCKPFAEFYQELSRAEEKVKLGKGPAEIKPEEVLEEEVRITKDEDREVGAVHSDIYWQYLHSMAGQGRFRVLVLLGLIVGAFLAAGLPLLQKAWMANFPSYVQKWGSKEALLIYGLLGVVVLLVATANQIFWLERGIQAGRDLHDGMLQRVLGTRIRFFDATPVGRILQRFSRDVESVDIHLQWSFESFAHCVLNVAVALLLVLGVLPLMIFVVLPAFWIYYRTQKIYRQAAREAKRLDSIARSPRYAHYKEVLQGLVVLRAFQKQQWATAEFRSRLEHSQRMFFAHYLLNRWFSSRVPLIGGLISFATIAGVIFAAKSGYLQPGVAGLVTIYSLSFWAQLNWGIRIFADIESRMTSVERIKYMHRLPAEEKPASILLADERLPVGDIEISDLHVRYAEDLPEVLKGINLRIRRGSKVGIVGRTGSGKSTLFQSLFRLVDKSAGDIKVGGSSIYAAPLAQVRKSMAIVPQDPSLFMGTLRDNLDRYAEFSDEKVLAALDKVGLLQFVQALPKGLEAHTTEGGSNLSQGQRQLLCLARAFLMDAQIILMDEATASVDVETDARIQKVIQEQFHDRTVLIIAHRLETVQNCDLIVQFADGHLKQIIENKNAQHLALQNFSAELVE